MIPNVTALLHSSMWHCESQVVSLCNVGWHHRGSVWMSWVKNEEELSTNQGENLISL